MTLSAFAWNIVRAYTYTGESPTSAAGAGWAPVSNLVMYVSAADND